MAVLDGGLFDKISDLKASLLYREKNTIDRNKLRELLTFKIGAIKRLKVVCAEELKNWFGARPLLAVDGSVNSVGGVFPYVICFFQAYAKSSNGGGVAIADYFTPLLYNDYNVLEKLANKNATSYDFALNMYAERKLCSLEIESALAALKKYHPFLVIFDGGFLRFTRHAPKLWSRYKKESLAEGVLSVGVIEEAASQGLFRALRTDLESSQPVEMPFYDRELLFGVLSTGECLFPAKEKELKKEYYTVFARLSNAPQAVACDFFAEQASEVERVMNYLFTISPKASRGIPLFLDVVDAETRLSNEDIRLILESRLNIEVLEKFYKTNRERRDF